MADVSGHTTNGSSKGFDNIDHHWLMERVCARVRDGKVARLIAAILECRSPIGWLPRTEKGTPQAGVILPLLANVALGVIEK